MSMLWPLDKVVDFLSTKEWTSQSCLSVCDDRVTVTPERETLHKRADNETDIFTLLFLLKNNHYIAFHLIILFKLFWIENFSWNFWNAFTSWGLMHNCIDNGRFYRCSRTSQLHAVNQSSDVSNCFSSKTYFKKLSVDRKTTKKMYSSGNV